MPALEYKAASEVEERSLASWALAVEEVLDLEASLADL